MSKIRIRTILKKENRKEEKAFDAIKQDKKIIYHDDLCKVTIEFGEFLVMTRENDEYKITMNFKEKQITQNEYELKSGNSVYLEMYTDYLLQEENKLDVHYQVIGSDKIEFTLEVEYGV